MIEQPKAAPGWYADPAMAGTRRYWDGNAWTDHVAPSDQPTSAPGSIDARTGKPTDSTGLIVAGLVTACLFPIVGFIIDIVLLARGRAVGAGVACMILSLFAFFMWMGAMSGPTYY
jgi:hypothetical protein